MRTIYKRANIFLATFILVLIMDKSLYGQAVVQTFTHTGSMQTFTVPSCVSQITIDARGAQGGNSADKLTTNSTGGLGGRAQGVMTVTTGQVLNIFVGGVGNVNGSGGYNGGGTGGSSTAGSSCNGGPAAGGGGASDIRIGGVALANRIIVAGGGGGSGRDYCNGSCQPCGCGGSGGAGGGLSGVVGQAANNCGYSYPGSGINGGAAGTATAGGTGGASDGGSGNGGTSGALGVGGNGGSGAYDVAGGGGGGGHYGGGGGGSASNGSGVGGGGGGGGSSYITGLINGTTTQSFQTSNGSITLSYDFNGAGVSVTTPSPAICNGNTTTLNAASVLSYTWLAGPGFPASNSPTVTVNPSVTTVYTVQGTNNLGCISTAITTIAVNNSVPSLTIANSSSGSICPSQTVNISATGATTYNFTGGISNGVTFVPAASTVYTITGGNACGVSTATTGVTVNQTPTVTATASSPSICSGNSVTLVASGASTYSWSTGLPNGSTIYPSFTGTYVVTGTNSANNCTSTAAVVVTVVPTPILAPVATPTRICIGSSATISASGASSYSWSSGPTTSSIVVSPQTTTTYTVTKSNGNCVDTKVITLIVNPLPTVFAIGNPSIVCSTHPATLNAGGGQTYNWAPYGGNSSQAIVNPANTTVFTVTASDGSCTASANVTVATNPLPTVNIVSSGSVICAGQSVSMTVSGTDTYSWTNPSTLGTATSVIVSPNAPILYQVEGTNTVTGCSSSTTQIVLVNPLPTMTVAATKTLVCNSGPSTLTVKGASNTYTYNWSTGPTSTATIVNPVTSSIYSVIATNTVTGCQSMSIVAVNVFQPTFAVNNPTSSCLGGTINLTASGAISYTWNGTSPFQSISVSPTTPTFYVVAATSSLNGVVCISSNTVNVAIYDNPTITAVPSRTSICRGEQVNLIGGGGTTYTWSNQMVGSPVTVTLQGQTNFTVTGVDQNGCKNTATLQVKVSSCVGLNEENSNSNKLSVYPNPANGEFIIETAEDIRLILINELGQVIRNISLDSSNNHKTKISGIAEGVYFITGKNDAGDIRHKLIISK